MQLELALTPPDDPRVTLEDLEALVAAELVVPVRRTADGRVTEYRLTWLARRMLGQSDPCERP